MSITTGVCPEAIVASVGLTLMKLPASASFLKNATPFDTSSNVPPSALLIMKIPFIAADDPSGSPLRAILPLNFGSSRSLSLVIVPNDPEYPIVIVPV